MGAERFAAEDRHPARYSDVVADRQLAELAPSDDRKERMGNSGLDLTSEPRLDLENRLDAVIDISTGPGPGELQVPGEGHQAALSAGVDLFDGVDAAVVEQDLGVRAQALAHRRSRGENDQVALVEARGEAVEVFEARLDTRYFALLLVEALDHLKGTGRELRDGREMFPERPVGDAVDELLRRVERLADVLGLPESVLRDAAPDVYDGPEQRLAAHDIRIPAGVGSRRDALDDLEDVRPAAYPLELVDAPELVGEGELVYGTTARVQPHHGPVDDPVHLGVEIVGSQPLGDRRNRRLRDQHRAYDGPLGIQVVRRYPGRLGPGLYAPHPPPAFHNLPGCSKKAPVTRREP